MAGNQKSDVATPPRVETHGSYGGRVFQTLFDGAIRTNV